MTLIFNTLLLVELYGRCIVRVCDMPVGHSGDADDLVFVPFASRDKVKDEKARLKILQVGLSSEDAVGIISLLIPTSDLCDTSSKWLHIHNSACLETTLSKLPIKL